MVKVSHSDKMLRVLKNVRRKKSACGIKGADIVDLEPYGDAPALIRKERWFYPLLPGILLLQFIEKNIMILIRTYMVASAKLTFSAMV